MNHIDFPLFQFDAFIDDCLEALVNFTVMMCDDDIKV